MTYYTNEAVISVRFQVEGWHRWPDAPPHRGYLAQSHRHMFHVEATLPVGHDDREVEFHDFLDFCRIHFEGGDRGAQSCEVMARDLLASICGHYARSASVKVFEDGEVGATVSSLKWEGDTRPPKGWRLLEVTRD